MADSSPATSIIEGTVKFRDGKKWKSRWCVMRKLSPVADCVHLQLYKDLKERQKNGQTKASLSLQQFVGFESGFTLDKESNTLAILCEDVVPVLAFDTREVLIQWRVKVQHNLGSSREFAAVLVSAPSEVARPGPVRLHAAGPRLALAANRPPQLLALWDVKLLRRYGVVDKRFCVEGGSRCARGAGLFVFAAERAHDLVALLDAAQQHAAPSRPGSVLEKRYSDLSSCMDDCFQTSLRSVSPSWAGPTSHTMHCLSDLDSGMDPNEPGQFSRRPTSLPRCTSCMSKLGTQLARSSTMTTTPGNVMSPVWTMENIMEKRSDSDRASIYSRSSGSASEYSVPRTACILDKSFESKRSSPVACCSPAIPAKTATPCQCWQQKQCSCNKKTFSGPYENYDVPKTPMPLIQEHPIDPGHNQDPSMLYDTPKKLKCLINGQSCNCSLATEHLKVDETPEPARTDGVSVDGETEEQDSSAEHSNYVNITPVCVEAPTPLTDYGNYANVDLTATLEKFESSMQILKSAGFSQEEIDALEDIPEHDDDVSTTTANTTVHPLTDCCDNHLNYMHMEPLEIGNSGDRNCSDNVSRISHVSDPTQNSESDHVSDARRSNSADFTKRSDDVDYGTVKSVCFTPADSRKLCCRSDETPPPQWKRNECSVEKVGNAATKSENSFVARFRDSVKIRRSSSVPSKSDKNRDSSSSNDSGVSTGSLKHHKCDFNEFEMPVTNSKSCKKHIKCKNLARKALAAPHTALFVKSNSSDPLKNITFQFEEVATLTKSNSCDVDTLTRRKKKAPEAECAARHSQLTAKSTSSGASDTSDYMESLSVSSLSSCDVTAERHAARPRSGREYGTRALLGGLCHIDG